MVDQYDLAIQLLAGYAAALTIYLLVPRTRRDVLVGGCLSAVLATAIVLLIVLWIHGVTSTLGLGMGFTAFIAFVVALAVFLALRFRKAPPSD